MRRAGLLVLLLLAACKTAAPNIQRERRETQCAGSFESTGGTLRIPPEVSNKSRPIAARFDSLKIHAQDLRNCLAAEQCVREWADWSLQCEQEWTRILEASAFNFFTKRKACAVEKPLCEVAK